MSGHTPGPWTPALQCSESGWIDIIAASADRLPVGYATSADCGTPCERRDDETKANARLIASAPELLEALIAVLPFVVTKTLEHCDGNKCREQWCIGCNGEDDAIAAVEKALKAGAEARDAIAKATGAHP